FGLTSHIVPNHLITTDVDEMGPEVAPHRDALRGRTMLVHKADRIDAECVARGYITGSGWVDYQRDGEICGIPIPAGMQEAEPFDETLFTPATKAESGHDENIGFEDFRAIVGGVADQLRDLTIAVYEFGRDYAKERGIILADTKFEFGYVNGEITLIDEILTPDSSRFWDIREYQVGMSPPSFDKQIVRNHLIATGWDREPPIPSLPAEIIERTAARYREAQALLAG
ncbi:MAG: phosphoribosylaminoimidazolesuccinocarboxamide synthase, partial [Chloroflexota bacterium]|nr:phosphoribosylaminoimidazolesuccinocarboxamide synthase [Chloroflexota bacterium]